MATGEPSPDDWFEEFKKLNASSPPQAPGVPVGGAGPSSPASKDTERRRHHRFEIDEASAQLYKEGFLSILGMGKGNLARATIDISEGGAQFLVHERLAIGTKVKLRIAVDKFQDAIEAGGIVRWCYQSAKKKEDFFVGVQFNRTEPAQERKIAAMRTWFTSPQYKAVKQSRARDKIDLSKLQFPP